MSLKLKIFSIIIFSLTLSPLSTAPALGEAGQALERRQDFQRKFIEKFPEIKTVGLIAPIVEIAELKGFAKAKRLKKRARQSAGIFERILTRDLKDLPFRIKTIRPDKESRKEIEEIRLLFMAVSHTLNTYVVPNSHELAIARDNEFDYSLGSVKHLLEKYQVDALLLAKGFDQISSGLKAAEDAETSVWGGIVNMGLFMAKHYRSTLDLAIADGSGDILWYVSGETKSGKFNDPKAVKKFLAETFSQTSLNEKWEKQTPPPKAVDYNNPRGLKN